MKIEYIDYLINNTKSAFEDMMKLSITSKNPEIIKNDINTDFNISVEIEGDLKGSIIFATNRNIAISFTKSFIDEGNVEENDTIEVISELLNKITLETKKQISNKRITIQKEKILHNNIEFVKNVSYIKIPFETINGDFMILAGLEIIN